uniref:Tudor domain-containing protein 7 n=1 Tax=Sarcophilus harrisii TaxID=9305 RepID=A0A7N4P9C4_SARHA
MLEADLVAKMLRAVLQSHKNGIALPRLQGEYKSLTGDWIPFKQLGYPTLEAYLRSVPAVVRIEISRSGEITCYAVACTETARIAQLVARQRSSKRKTGRQVNCQMRVKKTMPFFLEGKPKATLRQPGFSSESERDSKKPTLLREKCVKSGNETSPYTLPPTLGSGVSREVPMQRHVTMINRSNPKAALPPVFQVHLSRSSPKDINGRQINLSKLTSTEKEEYTDNLNETIQKTNIMPPVSNTYKMDEVQMRIKEILNKHNNGIWVSKLPQFYKDLYKEELNQGVFQQFEHWPHICTVEKPYSGSQQDVLIYPAKRRPLLKSETDSEKTPQSQTPAPKQVSLSKEFSEVGSASINDDFKKKVADLLMKYSSGLWANALPKAFEDMYKLKFPEDALKNLDLLSDVCTVDHISDNPQKAILYAKLPKCTDGNLTNAKQKIKNDDITSMVEQEYLQIEEENPDFSTEEIIVPPLIIPTEPSPSVLVVELSNTNEVVIRYVGKDYSAAQELMEDEMKEYYSKNPKVTSVQSVYVGQLVAVNAEEDAWLRAQIISVEDSRIKVCYVDYGFSEIIEKTKVYKLNSRFCLLSFQAAKCKLAGLEVFNDDPSLVKVVESLACGKIFAVEILEKAEIPLVVLYDTSGEDDININATCLKALCDKTLEVHLQADAMYTSVKVTNICSDGTLYCQVPCKGLSKLNDILHKLEDYFHCKNMTSEYFVSLPFCGKICLFHCKGKWSRVEVMKLDEPKGIAHIYLFTPKNFPDPHRSINRQITNADLWKHQKDVFLSAAPCEVTPPNNKSDSVTLPRTTLESVKKNFIDTIPRSLIEHATNLSIMELPPPIPLSKPGEHMDVYVPVACHPGHFVIQPWQELHKLEVLMEEMILYYSVSEERPVTVEKDKVYAAKVENKWHRVLLKGILTNGLVSVYELDYGKHELVSIRKVQPLVDVFRKLPFQAITAQLAGVRCSQWSEEASIVFRNHVEKKPLVALVQAVVESTNPWDRKIVAYLVDTSLPDTDIWIHDFMSEYLVELSKIN